MSLSIFEQAGINVFNSSNTTISNIFRETGLDWTVKQSMIHFFPDNKPKYVSNVVMNYRSDTLEPLGLVNPKSYKIVQNIDAFNFIDHLPNFTLEKVGMFNNGKKIFVVGKLDETITVDADDKIDMFLTFIHGHDGKSGIRLIFCPVRMFCMNQMNLMLDKASFKYNTAHTGDVYSKLLAVHKAVASSHEYTSALNSTIQDMISTKPSISIQRFTELVIPIGGEDTDTVKNTKKETRAKIIELYQNKDDLQNYKNTAFGYLSAVSDYVSHSEPKRKVGIHTINNTFIKNIEGNSLIDRSHKLLLAA